MSSGSAYRSLTDMVVPLMLTSGSTVNPAGHFGHGPRALFARWVAWEWRPAKLVVRSR
jgi:hypothetical protein